jgi:small subunit ribosomal protein S4
VVPDWITVDRENLKATLLRIPTRDEINPIANEQAVVEFYSR